jgi:hypothetical protein
MPKVKHPPSKTPTRRGTSGPRAGSSPLRASRPFHAATGPASALASRGTTADQETELGGVRPQGHSLARIAITPPADGDTPQAQVGPTPLVIQLKLTVTPAGDRYEREADRLARQVMRTMPAPSQGPAQRQLGEQDEPGNRPRVVQRVGAGQGSAVDASAEASIRQARGGGQPLPDHVRGPMQQAFGADFSGVRLHTDARSDRLNQSLQARAFTTGQDIFFRQGGFDPGSRSGQALLAHELTHVVQQRGPGAPVKADVSERAGIESGHRAAVAGPGTELRAPIQSSPLVQRVRTKKKLLRATSPVLEKALPLSVRKPLAIWALDTRREHIGFGREMLDTEELEKEFEPELLSSEELSEDIEKVPQPFRRVKVRTADRKWRDGEVVGVNKRSDKVIVKYEVHKAGKRVEKVHEYSRSSRNLMW